MNIKFTVKWWNLVIVFGLTLIFYVMKIKGLIDWPWFWVFSPLWIDAAFIFIMLMLVGFIYLFYLLAHKEDD